MRGLLGLIQWLSTAFVTFGVISWIAVGHPGTTTTLLWWLQDAIASGAEGFAETDDLLRREIEQLREGEEQRALTIQEDDAIIPNWVEEQRPLGEIPTGDAW